MFLVIPLKLTSSENFGFCPPTGSNQENLHLKKLVLKLCLNSDEAPFTLSFTSTISTFPEFLPE